MGKLDVCLLLFLAVVTVVHVSGLATRRLLQDQTTALIVLTQLPTSPFAEDVLCTAPIMKSINTAQAPVPMMPYNGSDPFEKH